MASRKKADWKRDLWAAIPEDKRVSASKALMDIFSNQGKKRSVKKSLNNP